MSQSGLSCSNFRPNYWRPTTCSNCLRPKSRHEKIEGKAETVSQQRFGHQSTAHGKSEASRDRKLVGVVSPYAVVEVRGSAKPAASSPSARSNSIDETRPKNLFKRARRVSASTKTSDSTPKRQAPPPPNSRRLLSNKTTELSSVKIKRSDSQVHGYEGVAVKPERKIAPKKPPRTFSTFLEDATSIPEDRLQYSVLQDCSSNEPRGVVGAHLASLMADTVQRVYAKFLEQVVRSDPLWELGWQHLSLLSPNAVAYKGLHMSLQKLPKRADECTQNDIRISQCLSPHPNLNLVRALLPPPSLPSLSHSSRYLLRDNCGIGTLAEVLPRHRELNSPLQLRQRLLLCMIQLLSAVEFIYTKAVCHRDIGLDCLSVLQHGEHWIVKLGRFNYAVQRPGPLSENSFVYSYHELHWLGGADSRLPPEILNTPQETQTLDYSGTDVFAVGCLFYEFLGLDNPFEVNSRLAHIRYELSDLPALPFTRTATEKLAHLLLVRDPNARPSPSTALLLCQALLWLPVQWLESDVTGLELQQHIDYDRGFLVASLATMDLRPVPLPHVLQANFLRGCNVPDILRALHIHRMI